MPYIPQEDRDRLEKDWLPVTPGELNYCITTVIRRYLLSRHSIGYEAYNACIGALESAKLELYRRLIASYEDEKIEENGDIY